MEHSNQFFNNNSHYRFPKNEKLCSEKVISLLFKNRNHLFLFPFKIYYLKENVIEFPHYPQILFSIPKKRIAHAVDRNRLKRVLKEIYRLNKSVIFKEINQYPPSLAVVYVGNEIISGEVLKQKLISILLRLKNV